MDCSVIVFDVTRSRLTRDLKLLEGPSAKLALMSHQLKMIQFCDTNAK